MFKPVFLNPFFHASPQGAFGLPVLAVPTMKLHTKGYDSAGKHAFRPEGHRPVGAKILLPLKNQCVPGSRGCLACLEVGLVVTGRELWHLEAGDVAEHPQVEDSPRDREQSDPQ